MRNLKRVLSLTLASVMLLGMMVIGASAVDYPDVGEEDNVEAIDVLTAVDIMEGFPDGSFHPDELVTRAQMAKIMTLLTNLNTYVAGSNPFNDVPSWAEGYVSACYVNGIIKGYGNGSFGSDDPVTAVQVAAMLMHALNVKTPDGFTVSTNSTNYVYVVDRELSISNAINTDTALGGNSSTGLEGPILDLGEHLYRGDLRLKKDDIDDFGTPARTWEYKGQEIGTYAKVELLRGDGYSTKVTGKQLYDLLTRNVIDEYDLDVYVDGALVVFDKNSLVRTNEDGIKSDDMPYNTSALTGNGVLTEVYVDTETKEITVVIINTWLARATTDYNANTGTVNLEVYRGYGESDTISSIKSVDSVDSEDFPMVADLKKDDLILVQWADMRAPLSPTRSSSGSATWPTPSPTWMSPSSAKTLTTARPLSAAPTRPA